MTTPKKNIPLAERIILALDVAEPGRAIALVEQLDNQIRFFKVGLQLFLAGGWPVMEKDRGLGQKGAGPSPHFSQAICCKA